MTHCECGDCAPWCSKTFSLHLLYIWNLCLVGTSKYLSKTTTGLQQALLPFPCNSAHLRISSWGVGGGKEHRPLPIPTEMPFTTDLRNSPRRSLTYHGTLQLSTPEHSAFEPDSVHTGRATLSSAETHLHQDRSIEQQEPLAALGLI